MLKNTPQVVNLVFNRNDVIELCTKVHTLEKEVRDLKHMVAGFNRFYHYPPWVTWREAIEMLPFRAKKTLKKWVDRGVIRVKSISESGNKLAYSKEDCLLYAERAEDWLRQNQIFEDLGD